MTAATSFLGVPAVGPIAYRTVVVGADGSASCLRAVVPAGASSGACGATLAVTCAYPSCADSRRTARARAADPDADEGCAVAVTGSPVEALLDVVRRWTADRLVVRTTG